MRNQRTSQHWWANLKPPFAAHISHARPDPEHHPGKWPPSAASASVTRTQRTGRPAPLAEAGGLTIPHALAVAALPDRELLDRIDQAYDLAGPLEWAAPSAADGSSLRLRAGEREYLLHAVEPRAGGALALTAEVELITYLAEHYFPVARVLKTRAEADYLRGDACFYILTTAEATQAFQPANQTHRLESAAGLAQFHELMREYPGPLPLGASQFLSDALLCETEWIETNAERRFDASAFGRWTGFKNALLNARDEMRQLAPAVAAVYQDEPKLLIHGAYDRSAVTFDGLGLADVQNFEQIGYDVRLADLSNSVASFCSMRGAQDVTAAGLDPRLLEEFLTAYEEESPLTGREAGALPYFLRANHLIRVVGECRKLIEAAGPDKTAKGGFEAGAVALSLQLGPLTRPPPRTRNPAAKPAT
jgi:Ser/Thr protein kinase RdoA (MazF antagonist)